VYLIVYEHTAMHVRTNSAHYNSSKLLYCDSSTPSSPNGLTKHDMTQLHTLHRYQHNFLSSTIHNHTFSKRLSAVTLFTTYLLIRMMNTSQYKVNAHYDINLLVLVPLLPATIKECMLSLECIHKLYCDVAVSGFPTVNEVCPQVVSSCECF